MAWYSRVPNSKDIYVALFNIGDKDQDVSVDFSVVGFKGDVNVRNLWKKQMAGKYKNTYTTPINKHGAVLLRLTPSN